MKVGKISLQLYNNKLFEITKRYIKYFSEYYEIPIEIQDKNDLLSIKDKNLGIVSEWLNKTEYLDEILNFEIDFTKELPQEYKCEGLTLEKYYNAYIGQRELILEFDIEYGDFNSMYISFTEFISSIYRFNSNFNL